MEWQQRVSDLTVLSIVTELATHSRVKAMLYMYQVDSVGRQGV